ncbi:MAG: GDP-mannose dehydrogenase, partial [Candidatus Margulisbacteria bacterium]|nr:GDP-mannose dehydrogenase [Candidatus Margulisiibacteriota bacterium]
MKLSIFGLGYVGTVMGAILADRGFHVTGIDVNPQKVEDLNNGCSPIIEDGVPELISQHSKTGTHRFIATTKYLDAVESDISFICVGTPSSSTGDMDLG